MTLNYDWRSWILKRSYTSTSSWPAPIEWSREPSTWPFVLDPSHPRFWKPYQLRYWFYNWNVVYWYRSNFRYLLSFVTKFVVQKLVYCIIARYTDVTWKLEHKATAVLRFLWSTLKMHRRSKKKRGRKGRNLESQGALKPQEEKRERERMGET